MRSSKSERINIIFPTEVAERLRQIASGQRSRLVAEATKKVLGEKTKAGLYKRLVNLRKKQKPLPRGTVVNWVREDRENH